MFRRSPYVMVAGISLLLAAATGLFVLRSKSGTTNLAFWFDSVSDDARKTLPRRLPDGLSLEDMKLIEAASREEIVRAFLAYPISIVGRVAAHYQVRVVDGLNGPYGGTAESYAFPGFGGQGFVSFRIARAWRDCPCSTGSRSAGNRRRDRPRHRPRSRARVHASASRQTGAHRRFN